MVVTDCTELKGFIQVRGRIGANLTIGTSTTYLLLKFLVFTRSNMGTG